MFDIRLVNIALELWSAAFCVVCIIACLLLVHEKGELRNLIVAGLALEFVAASSDAVALIYRGEIGHLASLATRAGSALSYIAYFGLLATLTRYLCLRIYDAGGPRHRRWEVSVWAVSALLSVFAVSGIIFYVDAENHYFRGVGYWLVPAFVVVVNIVNTFYAIKDREKLGQAALTCVLFYTFTPPVSAIAQAAFFGVDLVVVATVFGFVVIFLEMQSYASSALQRRTEELARAEAEAAESRIAATVSQIQPHFLFNTLDTIYVLADEDSELTKDAIASFSRYLRANLNSLRQTKPVAIETELGHVRTYLELEQLSDEDCISFEIDTPVKGFLVPALAVQTLAENAVKHGIAKRPEGGCVTVRTRETPRHYIVTVLDDGVGFDTNGVAEGAGISNTRTRVETMCSGTLEIISTPGVGTTARIMIPKRGGVLGEDSRRRR